MNATLSGLEAGVSTASSFNWAGAAGSAAKSVGKTSGNSGIKGMDAIEGSYVVA